jgi:transglutaminase-like putative cysteine protease
MDKSRSDRDDWRMLIRVSHLTTYTYDTPATSVVQMLRLTPRNHDGQFVMNWRIDVSTDCRLEQHEDAFGNFSHAFTAEGPFTELKVQVEGAVETRDTQGVVHGAVERFPPSLYLRETPLTRADEPIANFAAACRAKAGDQELQFLHEILDRLYELMEYDTAPTYATTTAAEAFALKRGVCQDLTHIFIAAARQLGIPARYIGGHFYRADGITAQDAGHAWAEAHVENLGWVGFDPTNGIATTEAHVRVAAGLDYLGAAPVRGTRYGGSGETLKVAVLVEQARQQSQN